MLSISQRLSQQQKLSPQQIQYQKLLQLNTLALEQRIKTELELNPTLEEDLELKQEKETDELNQEIDNDDASDDFGEDSEFVLEDFMNDEDYFDESSYLNRGQGEEDKVQPVAPARETLSDHLLNQLYMIDVDERLTILGEEIIGNLDADGYLKQDIQKIVEELAMFQNIEVSLEEAEKLLKKIQLFDPVGIACKDLQECLLVQLQNSSFDPYYSYLAEVMLREYYEDFVQKRYDVLMHRMQLTEDTLRSVLDIIQRLNPKPGEGNIYAAELNQISPDFIIEKEGDNYIVTLNDRALPSININKTYL